MALGLLGEQDIIGKGVKKNTKQLDYFATMGSPGNCAGEYYNVVYLAVYPILISESLVYLALQELLIQVADKSARKYGKLP